MLKNWKKWQGKQRLSLGNFTLEFEKKRKLVKFKIKFISFFKAEKFFLFFFPMNWERYQKNIKKIKNLTVGNVDSREDVVRNGSTHRLRRLVVFRLPRTNEKQTPTQRLPNITNVLTQATLWPKRRADPSDALTQATLSQKEAAQELI